ncbi:hypothetical protein MMC20_001778 [Loxospora ochrophaea]|nr:hypothetical protein [Loxospora ochrophaea]
MLPLVALEEHYFSTEAQNSSEYGHAFDAYPVSMRQKLYSLGDERLQDMDQNSMSIQVISHAPTFESTPAELCKSANDELFNAVCQNPTRFKGFAVLPMGDPPSAVAELTRCITQLGFVGALVNNHDSGRFYDDPVYWPIFAKAVELDVPIYLHPCPPSAEMAACYKGNYSDRIANDLSTFSWGWHSENGIHILRLYASGLFDTYPTLKIIIGHMGEMLPYWLARDVAFTKKWGGWQPAPARPLRQVYDENI